MTCLWLRPVGLMLLVAIPQVACIRQAQENPSGDAAESNSVGRANASGQASVDDHISPSFDSVHDKLAELSEVVEGLPREQAMLLRVRTQDGMKRIQVPPKATLGMLRHEIEQQLGVPIAKQVLAPSVGPDGHAKGAAFTGEDAQTLAALGLAHGSMLFLDYENQVAAADADDDELLEVSVSTTQTAAAIDAAEDEQSEVPTTTIQTTTRITTTTSPVPRALVECRIPRPISEKWMKSWSGCGGQNAYKCGGLKSWGRKRDYCCCNTGCRLLVQNGKATCGDCASESHPDVAKRWMPKSLMKAGKCDDHLKMHECGSGNGCCCHVGYTWDGLTQKCEPDEIKYVGKWDNSKGTCTSVEQEESFRTGSSTGVHRLIEGPASSRISVQVTPAKVECRIPNTKRWQQLVSSCEKHDAYKCGPKLSTGKRDFCCCRTGCRVILREGIATCGDCQSDDPDVKERLIPEAFLKNAKCKDKYRMHWCGMGCCCNAGFSFNKNSMRCEQDAIKYVATLDMHKLKCTEVREVEYLTGKITTLEEPIQIPESAPKTSPEPDVNVFPRMTPNRSEATPHPPSTSQIADFRTEPSGWPEDEGDLKPPVTMGSTTQKPSFPFWLFPMLVFGVVLVAVIAFHYTGGTREAAQ